jgi:CubicO group peptidase (beta-lactamase class C family)
MRRMIFLRDFSLKNSNITTKPLSHKGITTMNRNNHTMIGKFRFSHYNLFVLIIYYSLFALPASAQFTAFEAALANFDAEVAQGVARDSAGCVTIAVFVGNEVLWTKGWGWADIENRVPATPETIGRTGSISKSFTAVAMVQLAERGIFDLDDPVADYFSEINNLKDPPQNMKPISFRLLASHTAGLQREPELQGAASGSIYFWEEQILKSIPTTGFKTPPGTEYSYSNIGFGILGLAISRACGVPFMELVEEQIFKPLGMTSSTFIINTPEMWSRMSVGYRKSRRTGEVSHTRATGEHFGRGYKVPNGGIYSTVGDLAKFAAAIMGESPVQILSPESRQMLINPQPPAESYSLGFSVRDRDGFKTVGHGGSVAGYNANLVFDPVSKIGVAMLRTTSYNPNTGRLLRNLIAAEGN